MPTVTSPRARFHDPRLDPLWDKVRGGERLTREDGLLLFDAGGPAAQWRWSQLLGLQGKLGSKQ